MEHDPDVITILLFSVLAYLVVALASFHILAFKGRQLWPLSDDVRRDIFITAMLWPLSICIAIWDGFIRPRGGRHD